MADTRLRMSTHARLFARNDRIIEVFALPCLRIETWGTQVMDENVALRLDCFGRGGLFRRRGWLGLRRFLL